jgi:hypothetical protein
MTNGPPSSHSSGDPQSVNPYAASRAPTPGSDTHAHSEEESDRRYQARLDWSDRQMFLKSVGPTRIVAVAGGLLWLKSGFDLVARWGEFLGSGGAIDPVGLIVVAIFLLNCCLMIYLAWLDWRYADQLRRVAGGWTSVTHDWSQLHYRRVWLAAISCGLSLAAELCTWLFDTAFN